MTPDTATLQRLAADVPARLIDEHMARLDAAYFERFAPATVARHLDVLAHLSPLLPADVLVSRRPDGQVECTILGYDAPGLFSLATGILMSLGFSIESGDVYTYAPAQRPAGPRRAHVAAEVYRRRRIVDAFVGRLEVDQPLETWAAELRERLAGTISLVERHGQEGTQAARQRVNEWVTQRLEALGPVPPGSPFSTEVGFETAAGGTLRLAVTSDDTPAFLYSLSAALALHEVAIKRVRIATENGRVHDELEVDLPRAESGQLQERVRTAVLLTKHFTYFLAQAADPYLALTRFDWLASNSQAPETAAVLADPNTMPLLARLLGASDFLWDDFIRPRYAEALAALKVRAGGSRPEPPLREQLAGLAPSERRQAIVAYRDRQAFDIQLDGILDEGGDPAALSRRLTGLAEELVQAAVEVLCAELGPPPAPFGLFGLGKFGAAALGFASDLELLLVFEGSGPGPYFAELLERLRGLFRGKQEGLFELDLRLRPWGKNAALECPLATFEAYYRPGGEAHSLERIALTRLRAIAGDADFGRRVEQVRDRLMYGQAWLDMDQLSEVRARQFRQKKAGARNAKYSAGALVDVEYAVQILQVRQRLPTPYLEVALDELARRGVVASEEARRLAAAYSCLRRLINALRMLRGVAEDLVLPEPGSAEARHLARRMSYHAASWDLAAADLERDFAQHMAFVRGFVVRRIGPEMLPRQPAGA